MSNWISVDERLPEDGNYVLCWYEYRIIGGTHDGEIGVMYGIGDYFKGWTIESGNRRNIKVIAWQPLPAGPEEE